MEKSPLWSVILVFGAFPFSDSVFRSSSGTEFVLYLGSTSPTSMGEANIPVNHPF